MLSDESQGIIGRLAWLVCLPGNLMLVLRVISKQTWNYPVVYWSFIASQADRSIQRCAFWTKSRLHRSSSRKHSGASPFSHLLFKWCAIVPFLIVRLSPMPMIQWFLYPKVISMRYKATFPRTLTGFVLMNLSLVWRREKLRWRCLASVKGWICFMAVKPTSRSMI